MRGRQVGLPRLAAPTVTQGAADTASRDVRAGRWPRSRGGAPDWPDGWEIHSRWLYSAPGCRNGPVLQLGRAASGTDLANKGFPTANLLTLGPGSTDPLGSSLVVATAAIRAQYGSRLVSVYAPAVIASFGSGNAKIDILLVVYGGTAGYRTVQQSDLSARKAADAQLLANSQIAASATARAQLLSGDVDPRLPQLLAIMAASHPVRIMDFVDQSPGGGPVSLLRSVDLATVNTAAHMIRAAYLGWIRAFIDARANPPPRMRATGYAAYWPSHPEDRVRGAESA